MRPLLALPALLLLTPAARAELSACHARGAGVIEVYYSLALTRTGAGPAGAAMLAAAALVRQVPPEPAAAFDSFLQAYAHSRRVGVDADGGYVLRSVPHAAYLYAGSVLSGRSMASMEGLAGEAATGAGESRGLLAAAAAVSGREVSAVNEDFSAFLAGMGARAAAKLATGAAVSGSAPGAMLGLYRDAPAAGEEDRAALAAAAAISGQPMPVIDELHRRLRAAGDRAAGTLALGVAWSCR